MPVDPLEEARERLGRVASGINWGFVYCRSDGIHLWQADLTAILAELDRRSPPTREGAAEVAGLLRKTWHDFRYPPRGTPPGPEDADVFDAMAAALAAAPPPPDGEVEQQYSSLRSASPRSVLGSAGNLTDGAGEASKGWAGDARWPQPGDRVRFVGENGYDSEREAARKVFEVGQELTVRRCDVGSWSHTVYFEGHDRGWNGVMFARVAPADTGRGE